MLRVSPKKKDSYLRYQIGCTFFSQYHLKDFCNKFCIIYIQKKTINVMENDCDLLNLVQEHADLKE